MVSSLQNFLRDENKQAVLCCHLARTTTQMVDFRDQADDDDEDFGYGMEPKCAGFAPFGSIAARAAMWGAPRLAMGEGNRCIQRFQEGDFVEVNFRLRGSFWFPGRVRRVNWNGTYDILCEKGRVLTNIPAVRLRKLEMDHSPLPNEGHHFAYAMFRADDLVEVNYQGRGVWYPGRIWEVCFDGSYIVQYHNREFETDVPSECVRQR